VIVLKLGGSVLTRKGEPETVDRATLESLATTVAGAGVEDLVVVHGGGSFGHYHADRHGVSRTAGTRDAAAVRAVHGAMAELNEAVVGALADAGAPAVPHHPLSVAVRDSGGTLSLSVESVATLLAEGLLPVSHGDGVAHAGEGISVLSGDELVVALARALDADRVGMCTGVPGVLGADDEVVERVRTLSDVADALGGSDTTDVTGGMAAKVRELLALPAPGYVFDRSGVEAFLAGGDPGTRVG
jgi:isopentenyl phosphate kinase